MCRTGRYTPHTPDTMKPIRRCRSTRQRSFVWFELVATSQSADVHLFLCQVEWLWKLMSELGDEERSLLLRFATGSSRAPPSGFRSMSPRFNITAVEYSQNATLPRAATCFSQLKLPRYPTEALLRKNVMIAIRHGTEGFSFL